MTKTFHRYQLRPKAGAPYHLCPEKDVETALELAAIKIENPKSQSLWEMIYGGQGKAYSL